MDSPFRVNATRHPSRATTSKETYERLKAGGVEFVKPPERQPWGMYVVAKDPEGNQLVFGSK